MCKVSLRVSNPGSQLKDDQGGSRKSSVESGKWLMTGGGPDGMFCH